MFAIRKSNERGQAEHGWLSSRHTFSFGHYYDPKQMGFRSLRVMNEDRVQPSRGFGTHPHDNMEIISYVLDGQLEHRDSMGNGSVLEAGTFQRMTAGTGVTHSEFNPSPTRPTHFYQIWIHPDQQNLAPSYEERSYDRMDGWKLVGSPDGRDDSFVIHQDVELYLGSLEPDQLLKYDFANGRHGWLQVLTGSLEFNGESISAGDGVAISEVESFDLEGKDNAKVLLFDLA